MDKSVLKAFRLLELLARSEKPMGVTEIANASELGKSNVHRLLQTLTELSYVNPTGNGAYFASLKLWELGSQIISRLNVRDIARPFMQDLAEITKETVHLSELVGGKVLYVDKIESSEPVRAYTQLGGTALAYCTATGKAILAYQAQTLVTESMQKAEKFTAKTITNPKRFFDEAALIRKQYYAINRGEWRADIVGLAAPLAGPDGKVNAAIGISAPASRLDTNELEALAPRIVDYAGKISASAGCTETAWSALSETMAS